MEAAALATTAIILAGFFCISQMTILEKKFLTVQSKYIFRCGGYFF